MADPLAPPFGITEMPPGENPSRYPDLDHEKLVGSVETQGARFAWSRASDCPCTPVNDQTRQPDPNCALCQGSGVIYFGPRDYVTSPNAGTLTRLQEKIIARDGAAVIRGVVSRVVGKSDLFDVLGHWAWGSGMVTVRPENKIGYHDRLISLDSEMVYFETLTLAAASSVIPVRYPPTQVNHMRSLTTLYYQDEDYELTDGELTWVSGREPATETVIVVHYNMHPVWRVMDHPHIVREIARRKAPRSTPFGTPVPLPIQGLIRLEFLETPPLGP